MNPDGRYNSCDVPEELAPDEIDNTLAEKLDHLQHSEYYDVR